MKMKKINNLITSAVFGLLCIIKPHTSFAETNSYFPLNLKDEAMREITINPSASEITVLEWFNKGCPFVKKFYKDGYMQKLQEKYTANGVKWFTINSTKKDHMDYIKESDRSGLLKEFNFKSTSVLYDEEGIAGKKVNAKTTPHIFVFSGQNLVYSGAVDDSPDSDSDPATANNHLINALEALIKKQAVETPKTRPYGCSIKYAD